MKRVLCFLYFLLSFYSISLAQALDISISEHDCSRIDIRDKRPELKEFFSTPRDQASVGWCFAFATADLFSAELGVPVVADIGSGLIDASCPWLESGPPSWLMNEPAAKQTLEAGADLVTFSGDKLLGGPQVGVIAGNADLVNACSSDPFARASSHPPRHPS